MEYTKPFIERNPNEILYSVVSYTMIIINSK